MIDFERPNDPPDICGRDSSCRFRVNLGEKLVQNLRALPPRGFLKSPPKGPVGPSGRKLDAPDKSANVETCSAGNDWELTSRMHLLNNPRGIVPILDRAVSL
jgi:hypothetical protein